MQAANSDYWKKITDKEFTLKLIEFFERNDPEAIRAVPKIGKNFSDRKQEVFTQLTQRYAVEKRKPGTYLSLVQGPPMGANSGGCLYNQ